MAPVLPNSTRPNSNDLLAPQGQSSVNAPRSRIQRRGFSNPSARSVTISKGSSVREDDTFDPEDSTDEEDSVLGHRSEYGDDNDNEDDENNNDNNDNGNDVAIFKPNPSLPQPSLRQISIRKLLEMLKEGTIDVYPEYQRDIVWPADKMTGLINSIIENFYVPPLIFNATGAPHRKLVCVDGKQRLKSIESFVDGMIPCKDSEDNKWFFQEPIPGDKKRRQNMWTEDDKRAFLDKVVTYCEVTGLSRSQEEDLFRRVQLGVSLTLAEKLRAESGPWQDLAILFEHDFHDVLKLSSTGRGKGFQNLLLTFAQIVETENLLPESVSTIQTGKPRIRKFGQNVKALTPSRRCHLVKVFTTFKELIAQDISVFQDNGYKRSKGFAPVELVAVAVLISKCGENMSNDQLLRTIRDMRGHVRRKCHDLFANTATWKILWSFIQTAQASSANAIVEVDGIDGHPIAIISDDERPAVELPLKRKPSLVELKKRPSKRATLTKAPADNVTASRDNGGDEYDFPDGCSTSSGYSTYPETRRRPAAPRRSAPINVEKDRKR